MHQVDISCFKDNYHAARQTLLDAVSLHASDLMQKYEPVQHPLTGPDHQQLFLDWFELRKKLYPENVLVLISGTHGVEGLAGSAIQCGLLESLGETLRHRQNCGVILIHALNPWGMAWLRRYDHEGIDLNRNFVDFKQSLPENTIYTEIHAELFGNEGQGLETVFARWRERLGNNEFEAAITQGQYQYANGLFYGGNTASWSRQVLEKLCSKSILHTAERIAVIDLHTGLGPYGYGEVINDHQPDTTGFDIAAQWYGMEARSALLGQSCSPPKTGLLDFFWHSLIGDRGCFVTLEFGTFSLDELLLLSCEEQRYHNSCNGDSGRRNIQHPSVKALHQFFYPQDKQWRLQVAERAQKIIELALQGLNR